MESPPFWHRGRLTTLDHNHNHHPKRPGATNQPVPYWTLKNDNNFEDDDDKVGWESELMLDRRREKGLI